MKVLYLIQNNKKQGQTYLYLEVPTKLDNLDTIQSDLEKSRKLFKLDGKASNVEFSNCKAQCNSIVNDLKQIPESGFTRKLLEDKSLTCVAIFYNLQGEKLGMALAEPNGNLHFYSINQIIQDIRKYHHVNNIYIRNGKEVILSDGNYDSKGSKIPIVYVGTKINKDKIDPQANLDDKVENKKYSANELKKYKNPVKAMITHGFMNYVKQFKLDDPNLPEDALWFYYGLLMKGEYKYVANLRTTQPFTKSQFKQLYLGMKHGVDVEVYANPKISSREMERVRKNLENKSFDGTVLDPRVRKLMDQYSRSDFKDKELGKKLELVLGKVRGLYSKGAK